MKRIGGRLWEKICDRQNVRQAILDATKNSSVEYDIDAWTEQIHFMLMEEKYEFHPLKRMVRYEPKERVIDYAVVYPDKILINAVINVLKPLLIPKFAETTYSSIKGRGLKQCSDRIKKAVRKYPEAVYLQTDIKKYYPSIDHALLKKEMERYIKDAKCLRFMSTLIDNHKEGVPIGISAGSYIANLFLTRIDRWVYSELKPLAYVRYMDDQLILVEKKEDAHKALAGLSAKLGELGLSLKGNARICPVSKGIHMIGYVFFPTHTKLRKSIRERMKKKAKRVSGLNDKEWKIQMASYHGWCMQADCKNLMRKTFGDRYKLFDMEYKRLKEKKQQENFFGLPKDMRVSIRELVDRDIVMLDYMEVTIRGEPKIAVKFCFEEEEEERIFLTRSEILRDKLAKDKDYIPCVVSIRERTNKTGRKYYTYE